MSLSSLGDMLLQEIRELRTQYLNLSLLGEIERRLQSHRRIRFISPNSVECDFKTNFASLNWFYCRHCGNVLDVQSNRINVKGRRINCECGKEIEQSYVYVINPKGPIKTQINTEVIASLRNSMKFYCRVLGKNKLVKRTNRLRPLASLRYFCPDPNKAQEKGCINLAENQICTEGAVFRAPAGGLEYSLSMLNEDLTKPLSVSIYAYSPEEKEEKNIKRLKFTKELLPGVEEIFFVKRIIILQVTLCILIGHPHTSRINRVCLLYRDKDDVILLPYRMLTTSGLLVKLNNDIQRKFRREECFDLLHTLSHTFLSVTPIVSGLEAKDFGEAINFNHNEIVMYDNAEGGVGGIEGLVSTQENFDRLIMYATESIRCPLECPKACRGCLYTDACYMLNWRLNRKLLIEGLGWEA